MPRSVATLIDVTYAVVVLDALGDIQSVWPGTPASSASSDGVAAADVFGRVLGPLVRTVARRRGARAPPPFSSRSMRSARALSLYQCRISAAGSRPLPSSPRRTLPPVPLVGPFFFAGLPETPCTPTSHGY